MPWLCSALGPTETRRRLIPVLDQMQQRLASKDELLLSLAEQWRAVARVSVAEASWKAGACSDEALQVLEHIASCLASLAESDERRVLDQVRG